MKPECRKCKHFFVTHNPSTPMGCKAYQIQSKQLPSLVVKSANGGQNCIGFQPKAAVKNKPKNLNDPSLW